MPTATRRRSSAASRRQPPPSRSRLTPRVQGQLAGTALAWAIVLMAWGAHGLRSGPSVVFWLAATALLVYLIAGIATVAHGEDGWRAARKAVLLVLLVLVPVTFDPKTFDVFNVTKYNFLAIGGWVLAGLWVVEGVRTKRVPAWRNGLQWPVLFLVGWTLVTTISSINPRLSLLGAYGSYDGLYAMFGVGMVLFATVEAFRADDVKVALSVFYFGAGGLSVLYGVIQLHDHIFQSEKHWDWVRWGEASFKTSTIWATMGNPNHLAGLLVTVLPVGVVLFFVHRHWLPRVLIVAISSGLFLEVLQTTTRGAWLATFVALPVLAVLLLPEIKARPVLASVTAVVLVVGVLGAAVFIGHRLNLREQLSSAFRFGSNSTAVQRVELWKSAVKVAEHHPILGIGPDTFRIKFPTYQTRKFVTLYGPDQLANGPHNTFFNYLATEGFPGLFAFLGVLLFAALRGVGAWRRFRRRERLGGDDAGPARERRLLLSGIMAAIVAYVLQASFNVQQIGLTASFWLLVGLLAVLALGAGVPDTLRPDRLVRVGSGAEAETEAEPEDAGASPAPAGSSRPPRATRANRHRGRGRGRARRRQPVETGFVFTVGVVAVAVVVFSWLTSGPYRADHTYRDYLVHQNQASAAQQSNAAAADTFSQRALTDADHAIAANPWEADYIAADARQLLDAGKARLSSDSSDSQGLAMVRKAQKRWLQALHLQPDNTFYLESYAAFLDQVPSLGGSDRRAIQIRDLRRAATINPWQTRYAMNLANVYANENKFDTATGVLERERYYAPRDTALLDQLAKFYERAGKHAKALVVWRRVHEIDPKDDAANQALGTNTPAPATPTVSPSAASTSTAPTSPTASSG